ncbi:hypothetical protein QYB82_000137 [Clostridium perfringens]|nr:hypothetical protein [Clostridium perfringens]
MKIERIFTKNENLTLEDLVRDMVKNKIDKRLKKYYSNGINHTTSSKIGGVL